MSSFVNTSLSGLSLIGLGILGRCSRSALGCLDLDFFPALAALRARRDGRTRVMPECPLGWLGDVDGEFSPATSKSSISTWSIRNQRQGQMGNGVPKTYLFWKVSRLSQCTHKFETALLFGDPLSTYKIGANMNLAWALTWQASSYASRLGIPQTILRRRFCRLVLHLMEQATVSQCMVSSTLCLSRALPDDNVT